MNMKKLLVFAPVAFLFLLSCKDSKESKSENSAIIYNKIITSSDDAVVKTTSGPVAGYIDDGVYIYKRSNAQLIINNKLLIQK